MLRPYRFLRGIGILAHTYSAHGLSLVSAWRKLSATCFATLAQTLTQTSYPPDGKGTLVERTIAHIRENPWVAAAVALGTTVIALVRYAEAIKKLVGPLFTNRAEAARVTLARLSLEFTSDAFVQSAERGDRHAVEAFLAAGIDPNKRDRRDNTALSHPVRRGDVPMVRALLKAGADMSTKDSNRWTALDCAVVGGKPVMDLLLTKVPKAELVDHAFVTAAMYGNGEILKLLVEHGANVKEVGSKALTEAARFCPEDKRCENLTYLLQLGVDPNFRDKEGFTPLHGAALTNSTGSLRVLLDHGADVNARVDHQDDLGDSTALLIAAGQGMREAVEILLNAGSDVRARNKHGQTALIKAIRAPHAELENAGIVDVLLQTGADINAMDDAGRTALIWAAETDKLSIVHNLLNRGADVNVQDNEGYTALMALSSRQEPEIAKILLDRGADINVGDRDGQTALMFAAKWGRPSIVQLLLDNKADVNACDATGKTPLMCAAENGNSRTIRTLLERGAHVNKKERDGRTALQFAEDYSDAYRKAEMVRVLKAAGAK